MSMEFMVVGFMFDPRFDRVLLLRKSHPEWQRGLLNGVGGHVEEGEHNTCETQCREFLEETGIVTRPEDWRPIATLRGRVGGWRVWVHATVAPREILDAAVENTRGRDERAEAIPMGEFQDRLDTIGNVRWLVPLAIDRLTNPNGPAVVVVDYDQ